MNKVIIPIILIIALMVPAVAFSTLVIPVKLTVEGNFYSNDYNAPHSAYSGDTYIYLSQLKSTTPNSCTITSYPNGESLANGNYKFTIILNWKYGTTCNLSGINFVAPLHWEKTISIQFNSVDKISDNVGYKTIEQDITFNPYVWYFKLYKPEGWIATKNPQFSYEPVGPKPPHGAALNCNLILNNNIVSYSTCNVNELNTISSNAVSGVLNEGTNTWKVVLSEVVNGKTYTKSSSIVTVNLDTHKPQLSSKVDNGIYKGIVNGVPQYCVNHNVKISFSAIDSESGLNKVSFGYWKTPYSLYDIYSKNLNGIKTFSSSFSFNVNKSVLLYQIVSDVAGNTLSSNLNLIYDAQGPMAPKVIGFTKYTQPNKIDVIKWNSVSDIGCAGLDHYLIKITSPSGVTKEYTTKQTQYNFVPNENGTYTVKIAGIDKLGNFGSFTTLNIISDGEKPKLFDLNNNATYYNGIYYVKGGTNVHFSTNAQDIYSGIDKCIAHVNSSAFNADLKQTSSTMYSCNFNYVVKQGFTFWFSAEDRAGNIGTGKQIKLAVDSESPNIKIISKEYWNTTPMLIYTISDNVLLKHFSISLDNHIISDKSVSTQKYSGYLNLNNLRNGIHTVAFDAKDLVGNPSHKTYSICYDTEKPKIENVNVSVNGVKTSFVWNAKDIGCSGIDHYVLTVDGNKVYTGTSNNFSSDFLGGEHNWKLTVFDKAGNSITSTGTFVVDHIPPQITVVSPSEYTNSTSVDFKFKVTDNVAKEIECNLFINGTKVASMNVLNNSIGMYTKQLSEGTYLWKVTCSDEANNVANVSKTLIVDTEAPVTEIKGVPLGWVNKSVTISFNSTDNLAGVKAIYYKLNNDSWNEYTAPISISENGVTKIEFYAIDNAGNKECTHISFVEIDKIAPVTEVHSNYAWGTWTNETVKFNFTASDSYSGVKEIFWRIDSGNWNQYTGGTLTFSQSGVHTLQFYAIDNAGNKEDVISKQIKIDYNAPTITFTPDNITWTNTEVDVNISASDDLSGVYGIGYKIVNSSALCGNTGYTFVKGSSVNLSIASNGQWKICAYAISGSGVKSDIVVSGVYQYDNIAPALDIIAPTFKYTNSKDVLVKWDSNDTLSGIAYYNISINNGNWIKLNTNEYTFTDLHDGNYSVKIISVDKAGNENQSNVNFVVDTEPPLITITTPENNSVVTSNKVIINWTASDLNLDKFLVYIDGSYVGNTTALSYTLNLQEGSHVVQVVALDKAGNENQSNVNFVVDTEPPVVTFIGPNSWAQKNFDIKFNVNDVEKEVKCNVLFDNTTIFDHEVMGDVSIPMNNISGGNHTLTISCNDGFHPATVLHEVIKVDNTTPQIGTIFPSGSIPTGGFVVATNVTDTYSGVSKVVAIFNGHEYTMQKVGNTYQVNLYNSVTGTFSVIIKAYDNAGNVATGSTTLSFYTKSSGGSISYGGGSSGGCTVNGYKCTSDSSCCSGYCNDGICTLQPANVKLLLEVQPQIQTAFDNGNEKVTFILMNNGTDIATPVSISVSGINGTLSTNEVTISPNSDKIVYFITKLPVGNYTGTVELKYRNTTIDKKFTIHVLNYTEYKEQEYAGDVCSNASMHIMTLASQGVNVTSLYTKYDNAIKLMSAGNYSAASSICNTIAQYKPKPSGPVVVSPFFILVTKGVKENATYIALASILIAGIAIWLKRAAIIKWWMLRKLR